MGLLSSIFGGSSSSSSTSTSTTQNTYDQRQAVGDSSIGLAPNASFNLVNELPDNAVSLLSNFGEIIGEIAGEGVKGAAAVAAQGSAQVTDLTKQVRASTAAVDLQTLAPYLLAAGGIFALIMIFRKG